MTDPRDETHVSRTAAGLLAALIALLVVFTAYLFITAAPIADGMGDAVEPPALQSNK